MSLRFSSCNAAPASSISIPALPAAFARLAEVFGSVAAVVTVVCGAGSGVTGTGVGVGVGSGVSAVSRWYTSFTR